MPDVRREYGETGVAVLRGLLPAELCREARAAFLAEVKPHRGPLLRQQSTREEPHRLSARGYMTNALLGIQDHAASFPAFTRHGLEVVTATALQEVLRSVLGDAPKLVETMYFESSHGTPVHADTHYMDAAERGGMVGAWIALEEIDEGAGRFFVYPRSHLLGTPAFQALREAWDAYEALTLSTSTGYRSADAATNAADRARSLRMIDHLLAEAGLERVAPALGPGDVVLWSSRVMHGSGRPTAPDRTRHSLTAHYVAASQTYTQYEREVHPPLGQVNGMWVAYRSGQAAS